MSPLFQDQYGRSITVAVVGAVVCVLCIINAVVMYKIERRIIEREGLRPYLEEISASMPGFGDEVYTHNKRVEEARAHFEKYRKVRIASCIIAFVAFNVAEMGWMFR